MNPRRFLRTIFVSVLCIGAGVLAADKAKRGGPKLGIQSWTCRNMTFDQTVDFAVKHGINLLELTKGHLDPLAPRDEILRKKAILDQKGLTAYSFGVNQTSMDKEENRKLFEFAKLMGMKLIIVEPKKMEEWDNLEQLVKEYDIKLAIHNHGTGTPYGNPETVKKVLATRDRRIGVCLDIGWVTAAGFDAAQVFRDYGADRVYDMHLKDKSAQMGPDGKPIDTEIGQGRANYDALFAEIKKSRWSGVMAIETDGNVFAPNPNDFVTHAKEFFDAQLAKK